METAKRIALVITLMFSVATLTGCGNNAQTAAAMGGAFGAIVGQAIGHNTDSTLLGTAVGTALGYGLGNEMDKQAVNQAATTGQRVVFQDRQGGQVEATPGGVYYNPQQQTHCRKVHKVTTKNGQVVSNTIEEVCEGSKTTNTY